jgi:hypothetical protein
LQALLIKRLVMQTQHTELQPRLINRLKVLVADGADIDAVYVCDKVTVYWINFHFESPDLDSHPAPLGATR